MAESEQFVLERSDVRQLEMDLDRDRRQLHLLDQLEKVVSKVEALDKRMDKFEREFGQHPDRDHERSREQGWERGR